MTALEVFDLLLAEPAGGPYVVGGAVAGLLLTASVRWFGATGERPAVHAGRGRTRPGRRR